MSKKSNVHPDYYKTAGRDRPDDAASARFARAISAKAASQPRPDRMTKGLYFERPEPAGPASAGRPADPAQKETKKSDMRKASAGRSADPAQKETSKKSGTRKASAPRRTATTRKAASTGRKKSGPAPARPTKKR